MPDGGNLSHHDIGGGYVRLTRFHHWSDEKITTWRRNAYFCVVPVLVYAWVLSIYACSKFSPNRVSSVLSVSANSSDRYRDGRQLLPPCP